MAKTVSVRVHVPLTTIEDVLYGSYRGTGYWAKDKEDKNGYSIGLALLDYESNIKEFMSGKLDILFYDIENDNKPLYTLNVTKIKRGLTAMAKNEPKWFATILTEKTDIYTADALIQCALFGKIKYS